MQLRTKLQRTSTRKMHHINYCYYYCYETKRSGCFHHSLHCLGDQWSIFFSFLVHALLFSRSFLLLFSRTVHEKRRRRIAWIGKETDIEKKEVIFSSFSQFMQFLFFDCPLHRIIFSLCLIYLAFFCLHGSPLYCVIFSWRVICYLKFILRYYHKLYIFYISVRVERERLSIPPCYFQLLYYLTPKVLIFYISVLNFFFLALMLIVKYWDMKEKVINNKKRENIWDFHAYFD